jgi:hypothetical protein
VSVRENNRPVVRWVVYWDGSSRPFHTAGTILTNGYDEAGAKLLAAKNLRVSQRELRVWPYEECPRAHRYEAAVADRTTATELLDDALRPRPTDDGDLRVRPVSPMLSGVARATPTD